MPIIHTNARTSIAAIFAASNPRLPIGEYTNIPTSIRVIRIHSATTIDSATSTEIPLGAYNISTMRIDWPVEKDLAYKRKWTTREIIDKILNAQEHSSWFDLDKDQLIAIAINNSPIDVNEPPLNDDEPGITLIMSAIPEKDLLPCDYACMVEQFLSTKCLTGNNEYLKIIRDDGQIVIHHMNKDTHTRAIEQPICDKAIPIGWVITGYNYSIGKADFYMASGRESFDKWIESINLSSGE